MSEKNQKENDKVEDFLLKRAEEFLNAKPRDIKYRGRNKDRYKVINTEENKFFNKLFNREKKKQ